MSHPDADPYHADRIRLDAPALAVDLAVRTLVARYCDAVARFDPELFGSLWTADADWVVPGARTTSGRERIARLFARLRGDYVLCTQELMSGYVVCETEPDPVAPIEQAAARWQIREMQWKADGSVSSVLGIYTDRLALDEGRWRFAERRFDIVYRGPLDGSGAVNPVPDLPPLAVRPD